LKKRFKEVKIVPFVHEALREYGTYVVQERAIADIRDGLKPVQRRILYSMHSSLGMRYNKPFRKSAKVVGQVMGDLHPHGDQAIYEALVKMTWHRYSTIEGQGNFGGTSDPPAAARYTECRPTEFGNQLFDCLSATKFVPNYSDDLKEPEVIPSRVPLLLLNGSRGIAYGIAANIPPHNLGELCKLCLKVLKADGTDLKKALKTFLGPDFPTGILLSNEDELYELYSTGRGTLRFRCSYKFMEAKDHWILQVKNFGPDFSPSRFISKCEELADQNQLEYVVDATAADDEILVGFTNPRIIQQRVLPMLNTTVKFAFYFLSPDENGKTQPKLSGLIEIIKLWLKYREEIESEILRQKIAELEKQHLHEDAKLAAIRNLDAVFKIVSDRTIDVAKKMDKLHRSLSITLKQAEYIYDRTLAQLDALNEAATLEKMDALDDELIENKHLLKTVDTVIEQQLRAILKKYGKSKRKMLIQASVPELPEVAYEASSVTLLVSTNGSIERKAPTTRGRAGAPWWSFVTEATESVTLLSSSGSAHRFDTAYMRDGATKVNNVIGIVSDKDEFVVGIDSTGYVGVTTYKQSKKEFVPFKTSAPVMQFFGLREGDRVVCIDSGKSKVVSYEELSAKSRRQNSKPVRLMARRSGYKLLHVPNGAIVVNKNGAIIPSEKWENMHRYQQRYVVYPQNYVIMADGSKNICTSSKIRNMLSRGEEITSVLRI